jgi:hypothetical protein
VSAGGDAIVVVDKDGVVAAGASELRVIAWPIYGVRS